MAQSIEVKGKSVDEAVYNGLMQLGLGIDEVDIEILEEGGKGFLGIGKSARVRLTERETPDYMLTTEVEMEAEPEPEPRHEREPEPQQQTSERRQNHERPARSRGRDRHEPGNRRQSSKKHEHTHENVRRSRPHTRPETVVEEVIEEETPIVPMLDTVTNPKAVEAIDYLTGLFNEMGVDAAVGALVTTDDTNIRLRITGKDTSVLIGRRGETLDALQYLTGLVVNKNADEYIRVMLDAENYRQKRQQTLEALARRLASKVAGTGRSVHLEPMNPYERRILHAALQDDPRVETCSEGMDQDRHVVIRKKKSGPRERFS